jgi:hypothetical protein
MTCESELTAWGPEAEDDAAATMCYALYLHMFFFVFFFTKSQLTLCIVLTD